MVFGIVTAQQCYLRARPGSSAECNESGVEDEIFSGWAVRVDEMTEENGWVRVETHYAYQGYVSLGELRLISEEELAQRQEKKRFFQMGAAEADLLSRPEVQGFPLELLLKNAIVELLERDICEGWSKVRTAAGREGFVRTVYLKKRLDEDSYLMKTTEEKRFFFEKLYRNRINNEKELRKKLTDSARGFLGVQYRWGGKSSQGIDCSGLMFISYMENGILIFRDSRIHPDFSVHEITREQLGEGDIIYFPGHVAMYLGEGKYIHSTGYAKQPGVGISSLNPEDEDYREDLAEKIVAYGSVFGK